MNNIFVRIILIVLALFGLYKMFPQISKPVDYYIKNPDFQQNYVKPAVTSINSVLPSKIQIPTPEVKGVQTDFEQPPLQQITSDISEKAADIANDQLNQIKSQVQNQFCTILLEKIKQDCQIE